MIERQKVFKRSTADIKAWFIHNFCHVNTHRLRVDDTVFLLVTQCIRSKKLALMFCFAH